VDIASADTADDTLLDLFGGLADQHIDNVLKIQDEKIPLQSTNVLNDIKMAANFYTASLYKAKKEDFPAADHWMKQYDNVINGIIAERQVENHSYVVERHMGRRGRGTGELNHYLADWV